VTVAEEDLTNARSDLAVLHVPTRIFLGEGALDSLPTTVTTLGRAGTIIVGEKSARKSGVLEQVINQLDQHGHRIAVLHGITPSPLISRVLERIPEIKDEEPEYLIALGGGSVMDSAKLLSVATPNPGFLESVKWSQHTAPVPDRYIPLVCVPTTAGSGSEANNGASFIDSERELRLPIFCNALFPYASFVEPSLTVTLGPSNTAFGGVDMLCHVLEHYLTCVNNTLIEDRLAESVMTTIVEVLPKAVADGNDLVARTELSRCSILAITNHLARGKGTSPVHRLEHVAAPTTRLAHGEGLALLLPAYLRHLAKMESPRLCQLGERVWGLSNTSRAKLSARAADAMKQWLIEIGIRFGLGSRVREGITPHSLAHRCLNAFGDGHRLHPLAPLDYDSICSIYQDSW